LPEGPEVKVITDGLRSNLLGKKITGAKILSGRYSKSEPEGWSFLVTPGVVTEVTCKCKFIYI
jgi:formamidopyrimidine-DNA glycosylase